MVGKVRMLVLWVGLGRLCALSLPWGRSMVRGEVRQGDNGFINMRRFEVDEAIIVWKADDWIARLRSRCLLRKMGGNDCRIG